MSAAVAEKAAVAAVAVLASLAAVLAGRVFEITARGEVVWEWYNPLFPRENKRGVVYRMKRYDRNFALQEAPRR